jgi:hypothetical protein
MSQNSRRSQIRGSQRRNRGRRVKLQVQPSINSGPLGTADNSNSSLNDRDASGQKLRAADAHAYSELAGRVVARGMCAGRASIAFKVRSASKSDWAKSI